MCPKTLCSPCPWVALLTWLIHSQLHHDICCLCKCTFCCKAAQDRQQCSNVLPHELQPAKASAMHICSNAPCTHAYAAFRYECCLDAHLTSLTPPHWTRGADALCNAQLNAWPCVSSGVATASATAPRAGAPPFTLRRSQGTGPDRTSLR